MKRHLLLTLLLAIGFCALAAPLKNIEVRLTQPDGQVIHCFASGDEFYNYLHDANGFTIVQAENGYYVYAVKDEEGHVVPSSYRVNSVDPATAGLQPYVKISEKEYYARRHQRELEIGDRSMEKTFSNGREMNHGRYNNLVVFIRFAGDTYHSSSFSTVKTMFNGEGYEDNSLHNFYHHTSYNQLDLWSYFYPEPDEQTILSYEDIYPKQYYQPYNPVTNPIGYQNGETAEREFSMLERAIAYIEDMVPDTLDLDYNDDGNVDNVVFVIKGEPGEWASLLWPHRWCIYDRYVPLHDLRVYDFNLQLEQGGYFNVSTLCHEMCHSLSAPDLYHYTEGGPDPVGSWDLMCGTTEPPQQTDSYMKYKYGNWLNDLPVITEPGVYELEAVTWEGGRRNGYMIPLTGPQSLFIEYRDKTKLFDHEIPGSGLLVYRIDKRYDGNAGWNGYDTFDEVYLFRPGGNTYYAGDLGHAYFNDEEGRTEFNNNTDPRPFLTNGQDLDWAYQICNIAKVGHRMRFEVRPFNGDGSTPGPEHLTVNVNSPEHQVELSWDAKPDADYYKVYRDGVEIATGLPDPAFIHPYTETDNGYHVYSVAAVSGGTMQVLSAPSDTWVILGPYETIQLSLSCNSPYGTKGGELEMAFNHPDMKTQYLTLYEGTLIETDLQVPANTEVTFRWLAGFDPEGQGIHLSARHLNEQAEGVLFDLDNPTGDFVVSFTASDSGMGCYAPQHLVALTQGGDVYLRWTTHTENNLFNVYRDGILVGTDLSGREYTDDKILRSGTHYYQVESHCGPHVSWNPDQAVPVSVMCYYCEPPRNLHGTHQPSENELQWEAPQFVGHGMFAYDDNVFLEGLAYGGRNCAIKLLPEQLADFEGLPITHLEMYDLTEGSYRFSIYNGQNANNSTLLMSQEKTMDGTHELVRFELETPVAYDPTLPLWICVKPLEGVPIPCCAYVGNDNSCLINFGPNWMPITRYDLSYSWMWRAYTAAAEGPRDFTYNLYWGPEEGGNEEMTLGMAGLAANAFVHNSNENLRYQVTALWNGRETDPSDPVYLGPSVGVASASETTALQVYPNPVHEQLTVQGQSLQRVTLLTVTGVVVNDQSVDSDTFTLSMASLPKGVYLLRILSEEGDRVVKVVKN